MKLFYAHLLLAAAASLGLCSVEAKLGGPSPSSTEETSPIIPDHDLNYRNNENPNPNPNPNPNQTRQDHRTLLSSCHDRPGTLRYATSTKGIVETSCPKLQTQLDRGTIQLQHLINKCRQQLVRVAYTSAGKVNRRYDDGMTVADACPTLCGRPCQGDGDSSSSSNSQVAVQVQLENEEEVTEDKPRGNSNDEYLLYLSTIVGTEEEGEEIAETQHDIPKVQPSLPETTPDIPKVQPVGEADEDEDEDEDEVEDMDVYKTTVNVYRKDDKKEKEDDNKEKEGVQANPKPVIQSFEPTKRGKGSWKEEFDMELIPIHTMLMPDGQILSYGTNAKGSQGGGLYYEVWDYKNGIHGQVHKLLKHTTKADIFCSSLNIDPSNGNVIIMGGDIRHPKAGFGIETVLEYDVQTETIRKHPKGDMKYERWYGTSINLPNGDIFVIGGRDDQKLGSAVPEVYSPGTGFRVLNDAKVPIIDKERTKNHWWYPHTYVNSKGHIIVIMPRKDNADIYRVGVNGNGSITRIGKKPFSAHVRSPSIMFRTDLVAFLDDDGGLWVADISDSSTVSWKKKNDIGHGRTNGSMALLPDGRVVLVGGARSTDDGGSSLPAAERSIQIWEPDTNKLTRGDTEDNARLYHSSALILPDGALISAGGGAPGPVRNRNGQVYHPDYLYTSSNQKARRPRIINSPRNIDSGDRFLLSVDNAANIAKVTATKSGSSSHTRNCDTRWLDLEFEVIGSNLLQVQSETRNTMIGGLWLVTLIDKNGVPSEASLMGVDMAPLP